MLEQSLTDQPRLTQTEGSPQATGAERRICERHRYRRTPMIRFRVKGDTQAGRGFLRDISITGLGLLLSRQMEAGTVLVLQLPGLRSPRRRKQRVEVVHATEQASGNWLVGCRFLSPLSDEELRQALRATS